MSLKQLVLELIEDRKGSFISGSELAATTGVSRSAIWKVIKTLRQEGHSIDAIPNKGYCLNTESDRLSAFSIAKYLKKGAGPFVIETHPSVPSTNDLAKLAAAEGAAEGLVILAESQSAGKGRLNRSFYSPANSGVYFSLLLRPTIKAEDALLITTAAAAAVSQAIESITGYPSAIKWVNDIYCHGKKVSGILTEASLNLESGELDYVILGIGINIREPRGGFPDELREIAAAVLPPGKPNEPPDVRSRIVAETLTCFWRSYCALPDRTFLEEYKMRSFLPGKRILIHSGDHTQEALALAIDDACQLIVRLDDGTEQALSSGEVSVRMIEGIF